MQIDKPTDKIETCECGRKPWFYSIGYGRTPYYISCLGCGKSLHGGRDNPDIIIAAWNRDYRHRPERGQLLNLCPNILGRKCRP